MTAGDTLLIESGNYDIGAIWISNLNGNEDAWIVIKGINGMATLTGSRYDNVINLDNVSYLHFENIAITTDGTYDGIDGVTFRSSSHHVTFKKCHIYNITNVGINSQVPEIHHIVVSETEISHCSTAGIYWGYDSPLKVARDCLIENSYIHNCPTDRTQETGYGIQIKGGSYRNIVRDNVLHDVSGTTRAGIAVYYTNHSGGWSVDDNNIVAGNVIWNVPSEGIFCSAGITLENNIVFDAEYGISIYPHTGSKTENIIVRNNTVYRSKIKGLFISGWENAGSDCMVLNNVVYMENLFLDALDARSRGNAVFSGNYHYGNARGFGSGSTLGRSPEEDFKSAGVNITVPNLDFYPSTGAPFINNGTNDFGYPSNDFNGVSRPIGGKVDVGAYEHVGENNPGWKIMKGFKKSAEAGPQRPENLRINE